MRRAAKTSGSGRRVAIAIAAAAGIVALAAPSALSVATRTNPTALVSLQSAADGGAKGDGGSVRPSISYSGRHVAFVSFANNLSAVDGPSEDVFLRDRVTGTTELISGTMADDYSDDPDIASLGGYVGFTSKADNIIGGTTLGTDVFLRNYILDTTVLVSQTTGGVPANGSSLLPSVSEDGQFVAFESVAENLSTEDVAFSDIFLRDTIGNTTTLVSRATGAGGPAGASSSNSASVSADGRFIAFSSDAGNLSGDDLDGTRDVFVRDTVLNTTTLVSRADGATGVAGDGSSTEPAISADGRHVAFVSEADNLSTTDNNSFPSIYVRSLATGRTELVNPSVGAGGANNVSAFPTISEDGRFVAFDSLADNVFNGDTDSSTDAYLRDLRANKTYLISRASGPRGRAANGFSNRPALSASGFYVAFESTATNLSPADTDSGHDIYFRDVRVPPNCGPAPASIVGAGGRDTINGTARPDVVNSLGGGDTINGRGGNDRLCGSAGGDTIRGGAGRDTINGGPGFDTCIGGPGRDVLQACERES